MQPWGRGSMPLAYPLIPTRSPESSKGEVQATALASSALQISSTGIPHEFISGSGKREVAACGLRPYATCMIWEQMRHRMGHAVQRA